jgi:uncharacterized membrane protein YbhN (UPF0104 family)
MNKKNIGNIFALIFLIFLVLYLYHNKEILDSLLNLSIGTLVLITILKIFTLIINGSFTKITLEGFGKRISHKESTYISLISTIGNYFGPLLGGAGIRAAYLKKKHGFALTHFAGTLYGYYLMSFFVSAIIGLLGMILLYIFYGSFSLVLTLGFVLVIFMSITLTAINVPKNKNIKNKFFVKFYKRLLQVDEGWDTLRNSPKLMFRLLGNNLLIIIVSIIITFVEFNALGINITFPSLLLYSALGTLSLLVSFTPGAIRIKEAIFIFSSSTLMISNSDIIKVAVLDRGITLVILLISYMYLQFLSKIKLSRNKTT